MKTILFLIAMLSVVLSAAAQNEPVKCIRTSWPLLGDDYQIDTYNEAGDHLQFISIRGKDTAQWWVNEYDSLGRPTVSYSKIDRYNPFHHERLYDENNNQVALIFTRNGVRDTSWKKDDPVQYNEHGDPLYDFTYGHIHYEYDTAGNALKETYIDDRGDTTAINRFTYDSKGDLVLQVLTTKGELPYVYESKMQYDEQHRMIKRTDRSNGKIFLTQRDLYDKSGFLYRSYGKEMGEKWEMRYEIIPCSP